MSFHSGTIRVQRAPPSTKPPLPRSRSASDSEQTPRYTPYVARHQSLSRIITRHPSHRRTARRHNSQPRIPPRTQRAQSLSAALRDTAKLHVLIRAVYLPRRWRSWTIAVHTASSRNSQWRSVGTVSEAPHVLQLSCTAEQIATRLLRLCVYQQLKDGAMGRELGFCIVRTATILSQCDRYGDECYEAQLQCDAIGGRDCGVVQLAAAPASANSGSLSLLVTAGISMQEEVRACSMQVWRIADRRAMLVHEGAGRSHGFDRVDVAKEVLWFGAQGERAVTVRVQFVRRWWRKRFVMGSVELGVRQLARLREGELLKMRWMQSPRCAESVRCVVVDGVALGAHGARLELRLSR